MGSWAWGGSDDAARREEQGGGNNQGGLGTDTGIEEGSGREGEDPGLLGMEGDVNSRQEHAG